MIYSIAQATQRLNALGYNAGAVSNTQGPMFKAATIQFQKDSGLKTDGYGRITEAALFAPTAKSVSFNRDAAQPVPQVSLPPAQLGPSQITKAGVRAWPTQAGVTSFFGAPGGAKATAGTAIFPFPFRIAWDTDTHVSKFSCHELCAEAFTSIFANAARHYGQAEMQRLRLDMFGGCFNPRKMRGGNAWSMHAWGIAVDLDPVRNDLKMTRLQAEFAKPEYIAFWNIVEAHGALSLGRARNYDFMHFQFARL